MPRQPDPRRQSRRSRDTRGSGDDRVGAVGADDDPRGDLAITEIDDVRRRTAVRSLEADGVDGDPALHRRPGIDRQPFQGRVERGSVEPDRHRSAGVRAVGQPDGRPGRGLQAHRRDRLA